MRSKRVIGALGIALVVLSLVGLGMGAVVENQYGARAQLIQRVEVDKAGADLFGGDAGHTPIGTPQLAIIDDPRAFLPGTGENGARLVDEGYLSAHGIYPLQLRSVQTTVRYVQYGLIALGVIGLGLWWWGRRGQPRKSK